MSSISLNHSIVVSTSCISLTFPILIEHFLFLVSLQVAWIHFEQSAILTVHNHVITRNPRISVTHDKHDKHRTWFLHINNVKEEDHGRYMCQINTVTAKTQFGYLHVVGKCRLSISLFLPNFFFLCYFFLLHNLRIFKYENRKNHRAREKKLRATNGKRKLNGFYYPPSICIHKFSCLTLFSFAFFFCFCLFFIFLRRLLCLATKICSQNLFTVFRFSVYCCFVEYIRIHFVTEYSFAHRSSPLFSHRFYFRFWFCAFSNSHLILLQLAPDTKLKYIFP